MLNVNALEKHVVARLLDFFDSKSPWHRGLWNSGTILSIRETLQAAEAVADKILSNGSIHNVAGWTSALVGRDFGIGDDAKKRQLQAALRTDQKNGGITFGGAQYHALRLLADEVGPEYLERWAQTLATAGHSAAPERTARAIGAHLLDHGFSSDFLHRWWTYKALREPGTKTLAELVLEAHALTILPPGSFELLVAFEHAPVPTGEIDNAATWRNNQEVSKWLREHGFDVAGVRQRGGLVLTIEARDQFAAAELAGELVDRLIARVTLGSYKRITPLDRIWIAGEDKPISLRLRRRRVEVHALYRENRLYSFSDFSIVDAAMELVAPLDAESPSPAVAGGWAAIEALLTGAGDGERVAAADRMAALVACSFTRAELTGLTYILEKQGGAISTQLKACASNRDRCAVVVDLIQRGTPPTFSHDSDQAALARVTSLLASPAEKLRDVEQHLSNGFRRLYRHRNLVLHGGRTGAVGLRACLRTVAPLVGAGLDRIAHGWLVDKCEPLILAARARIRLDGLSGVSSVSPLDLLS